jgi:hypothetical protein
MSAICALLLGQFFSEAFDQLRLQNLLAVRRLLAAPPRNDLTQRLHDGHGPWHVSTDETITLLARMARFVIADISDAKSVLQELRGIVPDNPTLPVQAIIVSAQQEAGYTSAVVTLRPAFAKPVAIGRGPYTSRHEGETAGEAL